MAYNLVWLISQIFVDIQTPPIWITKRKTGEERKVQGESPNITKTRKVLKRCGKTGGGRKCVGCSRHTYVSQPAQKREQPDQSGPSRV